LHLVAPLLIPMEAGDRVKANRRDVLMPDLNHLVSPSY